MHYILLSARELYPSVALETDYDNLSWVRGSKFTTPVPPLEFRIGSAEPFTWCDYVRPAPNIPLFSPRLCELLKDAGVDNVEYFDATITHEPTGESRSYYAANVLGNVLAMDWNKSEYEPLEGSDTRVEEIDQLVLDEEKLKDFRLCRLAEFDLLLLADESIRSRAEKEEAVGVRFAPPGEWDGFST